MWTEQAIETLKKLALEGRSASWIAAALGARSRSAVIGKACRIGIKLNGGGTRAAREGGRSERPPEGTPRRRAVSRDRAVVPAVAREQKREGSWVFAAADRGGGDAAGRSCGDRPNPVPMAARGSFARRLRLLRSRGREGPRLLRRSLPDGLSSPECAGCVIGRTGGPRHPNGAVRAAEPAMRLRGAVAELIGRGAPN